MNIIDLLDTATVLIVWTVSRPEKFDNEDFAKQLAEILWKGILISKDIDQTSRSARVISSKSVLALTLQNIRDGSRLTRR
jgi:hypothetical protein